MADSFPDAARRHRHDARHLAQAQRFQNAGHLIGFAAECLVKEVLEQAGIRIDKQSNLKVHFPSLTQRVALHAKDRAILLLKPVTTNPGFLRGWQAEGRYEANATVADAERLYLIWSGDVDTLFRGVGVIGVGP